MIQYIEFGKRYGRVHAVRGLGLQVRPGETLALIGPNGSGKTTTLKAALGLVTPTTGLVFVNGHNVAREGRIARAQLGYLPQRLSFPDGCSALEVMTLFAALRGDSAEAAERLLERVGLDQVAGRDVDEFSGGMRQRLGIAVALLGAPRALVLDEPTAALDPSGALMMRDLIASLSRDGMTVLLSSHDLAEVAALADRVAIFVRGELVALGEPDALAREMNMTGTGAARLESVYRAATGDIPRLVA